MCHSKLHFFLATNGNVPFGTPCNCGKIAWNGPKDSINTENPNLNCMPESWQRQLDNQIAIRRRKGFTLIKGGKQ